MHVLIIRPAFWLPPVLKSTCRLMTWPRMVLSFGHPRFRNSTQWLPCYTNPASVIVAPSKSYQCPICLEQIGRKALARHIVVDKPAIFAFQPSRDMVPGKLTCAHCLTTYTTEAALRLHYQRASCPILLIEWIRDLRFGPIVESPSLPEEPKTPELIETGLQHRSLMMGPAPCMHGLVTPAATPTRTDDLTWPHTCTKGPRHCLILWPSVLARVSIKMVLCIRHLNGSPDWISACWPWGHDISSFVALLPAAALMLLGLGLSRTDPAPVHQHRISFVFMDSTNLFSTIAIRTGIRVGPRLVSFVWSIPHSWWNVWAATISLL